MRWSHAELYSKTSTQQKFIALDIKKKFEISSFARKFWKIAVSSFPSKYLALSLIITATSRDPQKKKNSRDNRGQYVALIFNLQSALLVQHKSPFTAYETRTSKPL